MFRMLRPTNAVPTITATIHTFIRPLDVDGGVGFYRDSSIFFFSSATVQAR